jgi:coenzyme F420-dependent glucose-6-phosphate dehydrogenase
MVRIGYHCSHEQFAPSELLRLVRETEQAGFQCAMSSDHFRPWSSAQGQSGFAWAWLGAAMQATHLPFGIICASGYRYHPAIVAQAAATLCEMYPRRLWLALGSGQRLNENVIGGPWPEKAERNARLRECAEVIRALLRGETVTHRGRVTLVEARLYSLPAEPPLLLGAAVTAETARFVGGWADGLLTVCSSPEGARSIVEAFRAGGGAGKPMFAQIGLNWAPTEDEAVQGAFDQWRSNVIGGEVNWELSSPEEFETAARFVRPEDMRSALFISSDLARHADMLGQLASLGFEELQLHQVGRNQEAFIEAFGARVIPRIN